MNALACRAPEMEEGVYIISSHTSIRSSGLHDGNLEAVHGNLETVLATCCSSFGLLRGPSRERLWKKEQIGMRAFCPVRTANCPQALSPISPGLGLQNWLGFAEALRYEQHPSLVMVSDRSGGS